jgi:PAS domain S-box-containing protein
MESDFDNENQAASLLQNRVRELEEQLANANATISRLMANETQAAPEGGFEAGRTPGSDEFSMAAVNGAFKSAAVHLADSNRVLGVANTQLGMANRRLREELALRKQAEKALEQERRFLRKVIDATPSMVFVKDWEGRFILVNEALARCYGTTAEEILGKTDADFNDNLEEVAHFQRDDREVIASCSEKLIPEEPVTHANGQIRWFSTVKVPLVNDDGTYDRVLGVATDITERKEAEGKVQTYARQLERSNQDLEQFAVVASHDLQEPLRKIEQFGGRLQAHLAPAIGETERDYFDRMLNAARRMSVMVEDLLTLSRVTTQGQPFHQVDLNEVMQSVLDDLDVRLKLSGAQVESAELPAIQGDPQQIYHLLQNLIANALKFQRPDVAPQIQVYARQENDDCVCLYVADNGIGFEMKYLDKIFQPFQRLHGISEYPGTGMGLAICRKIVERHGGSITASSQPGQGSIFMIRLPGD